MKCTQVLKHIHLLVGGDLPEETARQSRDHLKACLGCYREYQDVLRAHESLRTLRQKPDLSALLVGLSDDVLAELREAPLGPSAPLPRMPFSRILRFSAAAAVLLMIVSASFFLGQTSGLRAHRGLDDAGTYRSGYSANENPGSPGEAREAFGPSDLREVDPLHRLEPQQLPRVQPASHRRGF